MGSTQGLQHATDAAGRAAERLTRLGVPNSVLGTVTTIENRQVKKGFFGGVRTESVEVRTPLSVDGWDVGIRSPIIRKERVVTSEHIVVLLTDGSLAVALLEPETVTVHWRGGFAALQVALQTNTDWRALEERTEMAFYPRPSPTPAAAALDRLVTALDSLGR